MLGEFFDGAFVGKSLEMIEVPHGGGIEIEIIGIVVGPSRFDFDAQNALCAVNPFGSTSRLVDHYFVLSHSDVMLRYSEASSPDHPDASEYLSMTSLERNANGKISHVIDRPPSSRII